MKSKKNYYVFSSVNNDVNPIYYKIIASVMVEVIKNNHWDYKYSEDIIIPNMVNHKWGMLFFYITVAIYLYLVDVQINICNREMRYCMMSQ
jgi:hypothetical protein